MKNNPKLLECLFGHHDYSRKPSKDKDGYLVYLCKICKRSGYIKWDDGLKVWYDYDKEGNSIHKKWRDGLEVWREYDKKGNLVREKWDDKNGPWVNYGEDEVTQFGK